MDKSQENSPNEETPESHLFNEEFDKKDVINPSADENIPFGEEFDKEDVVNSQDESLEKKITAEDIDRLVAYDDERRKDISFIERTFDFPGMESRELSIDEALRKNFNDFLIAPKISGDNTKPIHTNRLPASHINQGEGIVEILEDKEFLDHDHDHDHSSVILNRSPEGELENIEILCKCGEKTLIKFDYAEDDMELTELEGKKLREGLDVKANVIAEDSQERIFSNIEEDDSEVRIIDRQEMADTAVRHENIVGNDGTETTDGEEPNQEIADSTEDIGHNDETTPDAALSDEDIIPENEIGGDILDDSDGRS